MAARHIYCASLCRVGMEGGRSIPASRGRAHRAADYHAFLDFHSFADSNADQHGYTDAHPYTNENTYADTDPGSYCDSVIS